MATNLRGPLSRNDTASKQPKKKKKFAWKPADPSWHPEVKHMYNSLKSLDHFDDFEATDMMHARLVAMEHSMALENTVERNAALLKLIFAEWKELGTTVATRRRLAIEAEKVQEMSKTGEQMALLAQQIITGKNPNG